MGHQFHKRKINGPGAKFSKISSSAHPTIKAADKHERKSDNILLQWNEPNRN